MGLSNALKDGEETKALYRTRKTIKEWKRGICPSGAGTALVLLTSVSGVVDGLVRLDEDVSRLEGHHQHPLLGVKAFKDHRQVHKLVLLLLRVELF